jgi:hypothetical protein
MIVDAFILYTLIRKLTTPFKDWEAFKEGVINEKGEILIPAKDRKTVKQRDAFTKTDLLVLRLKRLLEKVPGGNTRLGSFAAALWLIKEHDCQVDIALNQLSEQVLSDYIQLSINYGEANDRFDLFEELATTNVTPGGINQTSKEMGLGYLPADRKRKRKKKVEEAFQSTSHIRKPYQAKRVGTDPVRADRGVVRAGISRKYKTTTTTDDQGNKTTKKVAVGFKNRKPRASIKVGLDEK